MVEESEGGQIYMVMEELILGGEHTVGFKKKKG